MVIRFGDLHEHELNKMHVHFLLSLGDVVSVATCDTVAISTTSSGQSWGVHLEHPCHPVLQALYIVYSPLEAPHPDVETKS